MLSNPIFARNQRIVRAAENAPPMRRGERDGAAVSILQTALIGVGAATMRRSIKRDGSLDGDYGSETVEAVKRFQQMVGLVNTKGKGDGIVGRNTMRELDERAPRRPIPAKIGNVVTTPRPETPKTTVSNGVQLPKASDMLEQYKKFKAVLGKPCNREITNQCAIRMSVALMRCDIGFHFDNPDLKYTHSGKSKSCGIDVPHNAGAERLFDHLRTIFDFQSFDKSGSAKKTAAQIKAAIAGKPGLIFFRDCFVRKNQTKKRGDHIDFWDGSYTMNDLLDYNEPEEMPDTPKDSLHFFKKCDDKRKAVWFCPIVNS